MTKAVELCADEEVNDLPYGDLKIIQSKDGYRFSIDPFLLCGFARIKPGGKVADLGTGSGVIPLLLSKHEGVWIAALEYQPSLADRARRSIRLNNLQERIRIVEGDVRDLPAEMKACDFDIVMINPPYRAPATGRVAGHAERAAARHEIAGNYRDFLQASSRLLGRGGSVCLIFLAERLTELLADMQRQGLEPKRLRLVHARQGQGAKLILVEGRKGARPGLTVEPPLFIYQGEGRDYTPEVLGFYRDVGRGTRDEKTEA